MCEIPLVQSRFAHQYIRVYATIGFNPFLPLLEALPHEEKEKLPQSGFRPPYADEGTAIGAFNIKFVYEESTCQLQKKSTHTCVHCTKYGVFGPR